MISFRNFWIYTNLVCSFFLLGATALSQEDSTRDTIYHISSFSYFTTKIMIDTTGAHWTIKIDTIPRFCRERGHIVTHYSRRYHAFNKEWTKSGDSNYTGTSTPQFWRSIFRKNNWGAYYQDYVPYASASYIDTDSTTSIIEEEDMLFRKGICERCQHTVIQLPPTIELVTNYKNNPPLKHWKETRLPFLTEEELEDQGIIISERKPMVIK